MLMPNVVLILLQSKTLNFGLGAGALKTFVLIGITFTGKLQCVKISHANSYQLKDPSLE